MKLHHQQSLFLKRAVQAVLAVAVMSVNLVGCGGDNAPPSANPSFQTQYASSNCSTPYVRRYDEIILGEFHQVKKDEDDAPSPDSADQYGNVIAEDESLAQQTRKDLEAFDRTYAGVTCNAKNENGTEVITVGPDKIHQLEAKMDDAIELFQELQDDANSAQQHDSGHAARNATEEAELKIL